ncbi:MAG: hypothetical protein KGK01_18790 [Bradyrhizobium sp.]|uniref:hypothetical protein n=1 Tax=Bradyrhizobium sp. TaxID=376 RepID=UPI00238F3AF8|nr:hypothetical protein [Bradyrhizobium sp.]MDE2069620.1 hypothetical protein [Bradyrhizobium sp.]MDE2244391.1 hypothetical protein [Bradyrhizobium sp.]MDE2472054.1 hypothetical protein [Bradyrhizobium sp.]
MKMLKRLLRFSRKRPEARSKPQTPAKPYGVIDADEFTRLLTSRRRGDLKILARKLSVPSKVKI